MIRRFVETYRIERYDLGRSRIESLVWAWGDLKLWKLMGP